MSSFLSKMAYPRGSKATKVSSNAKPPSVHIARARPAHTQIVATSYTSRPVNVSPKFLTTTPYDAQPILTYPVDFSKTTLPEYEGAYAVVLDNVLSPSECKQLIAYTEQSAGSTGDVDMTDADNAQGENGTETDGDQPKEKVENNGWKPAMVNAGPGREVLMTEYRNSDRIIWDNQEVMDRLWARCLLAGGVKDQLARIEGKPLMQGVNAVKRGEKWHVTRLNERMRFLKYGPGQFFKEHCDGSYQTPGRDPDERSFVTLHLYLNDSLQAITPAESTGNTNMSFPPPVANPESSASDLVTLQGGATTFHSMDMKRRLDVDPKVGRVLLFQHKGLLHSGDYVTAGIKYTMRTDLMYELELPGSSLPPNNMGLM